MSQIFTGNGDYQADWAPFLLLTCEKTSAGFPIGGQRLPVGWMTLTEIHSANVRSSLPPEQSPQGQMMKNLPGHMLSTGNTGECPNGVSAELAQVPHRPSGSQRAALGTPRSAAACTVQCSDRSREEQELVGPEGHQAGLVPGQHEGWVGSPSHFSLDFILVHLTSSQLCKGICLSCITHLQAHWGCPIG